MAYDYIIEEQATLEGADIEKVYEDCLDWLKSKRAKIVEQKPSEYIEAKQGYSYDVKIFIIQLVEKFNSVVLNFKVPPFGYARKKSDVIFYYEFVEELWQHLGIQIDEDLLSHLYPHQNLKEMIKSYLLEIIIMMPFTIIITIHFITDLKHGGIASSLSIVYLLIFFILAVFLNIYEVYVFLRVRKLRNRFLKLYPGESLNEIYSSRLVFIIFMLIFIIGFFILAFSRTLS